MFTLIIVIRGLYDGRERDMWKVTHDVAGIEEETSTAAPWSINIWDAYEARIGDRLVRNYGGR
jgi:hypothetical protein